MNPSTIITIIILLIIIFFAVRSALPHFKGEGDCCGGGGDSEPRVKPKKLGNIVATKEFKVEGMHCAKCAERVENALNSIDHVNAKVKVDKKLAVVKMDEEVNFDVLRKAVQKVGYTLLD